MSSCLHVATVVLSAISLWYLQAWAGFSLFHGQVEFIVRAQNLREGPVGSAQLLQNPPAPAPTNGPRRLLMGSQRPAPRKYILPWTRKGPRRSISANSTRLRNCRDTLRLGTARTLVVAHWRGTWWLGTNNGDRGPMGPL